MFELSQRNYTLLLMLVRAWAVLPDEEWHGDGAMAGFQSNTATANAMQLLRGTGINGSVRDIKMHPCYCSCGAHWKLPSDVMQLLDTCPTCTGSYNTNELLTDIIRLSALQEDKDGGT